MRREPSEWFYLPNWRSAPPARMLAPEKKPGGRQRVAALRRTRTKAVWAPD